MKTVKDSHPKKPWYRRPWVWLLAVPVVLALLLAIFLQPIARWGTRKSMDKLQGYRADFSDVHVSIIPLTYEITRLKVTNTKDAKVKDTPPLVYVKRLRLWVDWHKLIRGHIVADVDVTGAKLTMVQQPSEDAGKPVEKNMGLAEQMTKLMPLQIDRISAKDCEVSYVLLGEKTKQGAEKEDKPVPQIWLHDINATVENLATRANLTQGTTTLAMSSTLQKSGQLSVFATADPLEKALTFQGQVMLKQLDLRDLYAILSQEMDLKISRGTFELFTRFEAKNGKLTGAVKPLLKDAKVEADSPKLLAKVKAVLANAALKIFSDRVPDREAVATVIPISGDLSDPKLQLWPTILGVVRNAFVEGLSASFKNVPPPHAEEKQGPLKQAEHALTKKGGVPKVQPDKGVGGSGSGKDDAKTSADTNKDSGKKE